MKTFAKIAMLAAAVLSLSVFASCKKDNGPEVQKADLTELNAVIAEADALLASATPALFPQEAIDAFSATLSTVKTAAAAANLTQKTADNLTAQLKAAIATFKGQAFDAIDASKLIFELGFNEGEGETLKTTGSNTWTATFAKGPAAIFGNNTPLPVWVDGQVGKALKFENGAHLEIADYAEKALVPQELSISVWVNPSRTFANNYIMSFNQWNTWKYQIQDAGKTFLTVHSDGGWCDHDCELAEACPENTWTHTVATISLKTGLMTFYINGEKVKEWADCGSGNFVIPEQPFGKLLIAAQTLEEIANPEEGADPNSWGCFYGSLDEIKVYSTALTDGQVALIYALEK